MRPGWEADLSIGSVASQGSVESASRAVGDVDIVAIKIDQRKDDFLQETRGSPSQMRLPYSARTDI